MELGISGHLPGLVSGIFGSGSTQPRSLWLVLQHTLESEQSLSFLHELGIFCPAPDPKLDTEGQSFSLPLSVLEQFSSFGSFIDPTLFPFSLTHQHHFPDDSHWMVS